jgi:endonuclease/exonuclease/phosphatase (EEP) superfamily protein YafD
MAGLMSGTTVWTARWPRIAVWLLAALGVGVLLVRTISPLADILSPLIGHWVLVFASAVLALTARTARQWWMWLVGGAVVAVLLHGALARPTPVDGARAASTGSLRVLALNTWHQQTDVDQMTRYLQSAAADVVVLSELGSDKQAMLDALRATYPHQVSCAQQWPCSMALLSRFPITDASAERRVIGVPPVVRARIAVQQPGVPEITVIGTHIHRPSRNPWRHVQQLQALAQIVRGVAGPVIVAGDFNAGPWSQGFQTFLRDAGLSRHALLAPTWPAWPIKLPQVALDHVLVSNALNVTDGGTGPAVGSDHLPVWANVASRQPAARPNAPSHATAAFHLGGEFLANVGGKHNPTRDLSRR